MRNNVWKNITYEIENNRNDKNTQYEEKRKR
jgi:hypothetical protein